MIAAVLIAVAPAPAEVRGDGWTYTVPPPDAPQRAPELSPLVLSESAPDELELRFESRGRLRFAELRYGDPDSPRVTLALDEVSRTEVRLFADLDLDRDRVIGEDERIDGDGVTWSAPVAVFSGDPQGRPVHQVLFRLGRTRAVLGCATLGYLEGRATFGERDVAVRRADGDANGFFTDPYDRLWLDLDGDGAFEPFFEQFPYVPILRVGEARYALRSDRLGSDLAAVALEGAGRVRFDVPPRADGTRREVLALQALLVGEDGTAAGVLGTDRAVEVPAGRYRLGSLSITLADPGGREPWGFVFSEPGGRSELPWLEIAAGAELAVDPLGELRFENEGPPQVACQPGGLAIAQPRLYTGDGLLIRNAFRGRPDRRGMQPMALARLLAPGGAVLEEASSGFA